MFDNISFGILDLIDIIIVTLLLYYVVMFVRGTRVVSAINGLFVLFIIYIFSRLIGLNTIVWIFENIFSSLLLIIVILFHEDIRKALSTLSFRSFFLGKDIDSDTAKILSETCFAFAKRRVGALIVLEMQMPLGDIAQSGTRLDALMSQELLGSIFEPKTPLHDGAVIVREGIIHAAACILPLAESDNQEFGTRHRAALGISQISDALVIVVSEERGFVTIAQSGNISKPLTKEEFERRLSDVIS